ncbi:MAG TPA: hypothetical protein VH723_08485 [Candidatus Limnocylindrales bacterium]
MTDQERPNPDGRPNREARRREAFGPPDRTQDDLRPQSETNPAFGTGDDTESYAGRPDQDVVKTTGAGTGGATESDDRVKHHEGRHLGNQPNS